MTVTTVTPNDDKQALMTLALAKMRDVVDDFATLTREQRREAVTATAAYLADLRAAGVIR